jgi:hypothetical protein
METLLTGMGIGEAQQEVVRGVFGLLKKKL